MNRRRSMSNDRLSKKEIMSDRSLGERERRLSDVEGRRSNSRNNINNNGSSRNMSNNNINSRSFIKHKVGSEGQL